MPCAMPCVLVNPLLKAMPGHDSAWRIPVYGDSLYCNDVITAFDRMFSDAANSRSVHTDTSDGKTYVVFLSMALCLSTHAHTRKARICTCVPAHRFLLH